MLFKSMPLLLAVISLPLLAAPKKNQLEEVVFSVGRGYYDAPLEVVLSTSIPEATIVYTIDGTNPSKTNGVSEKSKATVELSKTTILRAIALKEDFESTPISTHTYLFPEDILNQKAVPSWSPTVDQGMNAEIFKTEVERGEAKKAFHRVPTVCISTDGEGLFGEGGIYVDVRKKGKESELAASAEWIDPNWEKSIQIDCGFRLQGAGSRRQSLKKNFRLRFAKAFGAGKFRGDLFKEDGPKEFENLILRNPTHDSWAVKSYTWMHNARYVNDAWAAQTQRLMGHLAARQRWVHLFLNGRYWGVYALMERPDEHFVSSHLKKKPEDLIMFNGPELQSGEKTRLDEAVSFSETQLTNTKESFDEFKRYFDSEVFCDYFIANIYAGNVDWLGRNYYLIGEEDEDPNFRFMGWDAEVGFFQKWHDLRNQNSTDVLGFDQLGDGKIYIDGSGPGFWFRSLLRHPEFKIRFSDRLYHHLSLGGLLSPTHASLRYRRLLNEIEPLLLLESARWGDSVNKEEGFQVYDERWGKLTSPESWLFKFFFPKRSADMIEDFQKHQIFPQILPPKLGRPPSGLIKKHEKVVHLENPNPTGIIIFTTNGTDPREAWTGKILGKAYRSPLILKAGEKVMSRVYSEKKWSALMAFPHSIK